MQFSEYTTVLFPCLTILILILFYVGYYRCQKARPGTVEWIQLAVTEYGKAQLRCHPMTKKDILPIILVTLIYAAAAFFALGDMEAPQTFLRFPEERESVTIELTEEVELGNIKYYSGLVHGSYELEVSQDGAIWTIQLPLGDNEHAMNQSHADLFKWQYATVNSMNPPVKYIRITADTADMRLGELALYDTGMTYISPDHVANYDEVAVLFDEQETVPETPTYMNSAYFDEIYHARTAYEHTTNEYPYEITHPPLGKLLISIGISLFGMTPFGWRFVGTLFGVIMVAVLYIFLKNMFGKTPVALCGTLLFAFDFMHFTQTRIATIDTYSVFFILLMYYFMYRFITVPHESPFGKTVLPLFLCGLSFGLGAACKWTCLYAGAGLALIYLIFMIFKFRFYANQGKISGFFKYFIKTVLLSVVFFIIIPLAIYYVSYIPYGLAIGLTFENGLLYGRDYLNIVLSNQEYMFSYHSELVATHPYSSNWYEWLLNLRPILYYLNYPAEGVKSTFGAFGNPVLWWGGLLAIPAIVYRLLRYKDKNAGFILLGYLAQLLPWVFVPRLTFAYHYFPSTLFLAMAMAHIFDTRYERKRGRYQFAVIGLTCFSTALFAAFYPVLSGLSVPEWYFAGILHWLPRWPF